MRTERTRVKKRMQGANGQDDRIRFVAKRSRLGSLQ